MSFLFLKRVRIFRNALFSFVQFSSEPQDEHFYFTLIKLFNIVVSKATEKTFTMHSLLLN